MLVSLTEAKSHLRIDHYEADADLLLYIAAAEAHVANFLNRNLDRWGEHGSPSGSPSLPVPEPVRQAIKMIVGDLYENRESATTGATVSVNPTTERLLYPYRLQIGV